MNSHEFCAKEIDLCLFVPCFPAFFDLLISLGQKGLITVLLKGAPLFQKRPKQAGVLVHSFSTKNDLVLTHKSENAYFSGSNLPLL